MTNTPSKILSRIELQEQVYDLIEQLSEKNRDVLALRLVEELSNSEAAEVLEIPAATAQKRYGRALFEAASTTRRTWHRRRRNQGVVIVDHSASGIELDDLVAQVVDEYLERLNSADTPTLEEFVERYPEIGHVLKTLIPALNATQQCDHSVDGSFAHGRYKQIGDFRILRQIGRGGMGVVYEAEQMSMQRRVALKVLPLAGLVDELKIHRFQNEVRAVAALNHPNIVPVYTVGQERGVHYYAMQLIHGRSLSDVNFIAATCSR